MKKRTFLACFLAFFCLFSITGLAQTFTPMPQPKIQFFDGSSPLADGKLCTYVTGTSTPQSTYTDYTGGSLNTNPVILDSYGQASIFLGALSYRFVLRTPGTDNTCTTGTVLWTVDGITGDAGNFCRLAGCSYTGAVTFGAAVTFNSSVTSASGQTASWGGASNLNPTIGDPAHLFEIVNNNTADMVFRMSTYGPTGSLAGQNNMHFIRANGTATAPSAVLSADEFFSFGTRGHDGTVMTQSSGAFAATATENWNNTSHGTKFHFETTPNGSTTRSGTFDLLGTGQINASLGVAVGGAINQNLVGAEAGFANELICNGCTSQMLRLSTYGATGSLGGQNNIIAYRANGTQASPSAVLSSDVFYSVGARGYDGTANTGSSASFQAQATEGWSNTAHGTKWHLEATPNGSTSRSATLDFAGDGSLTSSGLMSATAFSVSGVPTIYRVSTDFTLAASTSLQTITGLTWTLPASTALNVPFTCDLMYSQATAAVADEFGIQSATISPTNIAAKGEVDISTSTITAGNLPTLTTTTATAIVTFTPSATATVFNARLTGMIENPSNASTNAINIMAQQSNSADLLTIKRGSFCRVF